MENPFGKGILRLHAPRQFQGVLGETLCLDVSTRVHTSARTDQRPGQQRQRHLGSGLHTGLVGESHPHAWPPRFHQHGNRHAVHTKRHSRRVHPGNRSRPRDGRPFAREALAQGFGHQLQRLRRRPPRGRHIHGVCGPFARSPNRGMMPHQAQCRAFRRPSPRINAVLVKFQQGHAAGIGPRQRIVGPQGLAQHPRCMPCGIPPRPRHVWRARAFGVS